jgi:NADH-quinone oxidoreductase subunit D
MELGALTVFLYFVRARDTLWEHIAHVTGARLTQSYARIGGLKEDVPDGWFERTEEILQEIEETLRIVHRLLDRNRIFHDRMRGTGVISKEDALNLGFTGPCLRGTGVALDCRRYDPYEVYDRVEFDIPVGKYGDNYDRYYVRMREMEESIRIARQCIEKMPEGPVSVHNYGIMLPPKTEVYNTIEGMIAHFKLVMHGPAMPVGDVYHAVEGGNGELGYYLVSDGSGKPYKLRVRPPSFILMGGVCQMLEGGQIADVVPTFGSINMIGGECDR